MASPFGATSTAGLMADPSGIISDKKSFSVASISLDIRPWNVCLQRKCNFRVKAAKECNFNKDGSSTNKLQARANKLTDLFGVNWERREEMLFWRASTGLLGLSMLLLWFQERYILMLSCYRAFSYRHCTREFSCYA